MKPEANADILYADIIDRQYQPSVVHRHMSMKGRAAQFAPFAALHGHSESIDEAARHTDTDTELTDENRTDIARRTAEAYDAAIEVVIRHFCPDTHKAGGIIAESRGIIAKINDTERWLRLHDGTTIPFGAIRDIYSESIDL